MLNIRKRLKNDRRQLERNPSIQHSPNSKTKIIQTTEAERLVTEARDFELTVRLHQSTVNELKTLSWNMYHYGKDSKTYDEIVKHLIKSYDACRIKHYFASPPHSGNDRY